MLVFKSLKAVQTSLHQMMFCTEIKVLRQRSCLRKYTSLGRFQLLELFFYFNYIYFMTFCLTICYDLMLLISFVSILKEVEYNVNIGVALVSYMLLKVIAKFECVEEPAETIDLSSETQFIFAGSNPYVTSKPLSNHLHTITHIFFHLLCDSTIAQTITHSPVILLTAHCPLIANQFH